MFRASDDASRYHITFIVRVVVLALAALALLGLLAVRVSYLTVVRGEALRDLSDNNYLKREEIPAPRGAIIDRYGRIMATNEVRFNLLASPYQLGKEDLEKTLAEVKALCPDAGIPPVEELLAIPTRRERWEGRLLARSLRLQDVLPLMERQAGLPGLKVEETFRRVYPFGRAASQWTGYVGSLTESEFGERQEEGYALDDPIGKIGLEKQHETSLRGTKGTQIAVRDVWSRLLESRVEEGDEAVPGCQIVLTVDMDLQTSVTQALENRPGAIIVVDPRNGEVLAMASWPDYDANQPVLEPGEMYQSKALYGQYPPGSIFKLVTATAALRAGCSPEQKLYCDGRLEVTSDFAPYCDARMGHGWLDMRAALKASCNVYFYQLAWKYVSADDMMAAAQALGFGRSTGISLGDSPGRLARPYRRELANRIMMGIGQGRLISVTPIQIAMAYAAMANGGNLFSPTVVHEIRLPSGETLFVAPPPAPLREIGWTEAQRQVLLDGFRGVVEDPMMGTARHAHFDPAMRVAGKTGSAEHGLEGPPHAWFVCFAPWDDPEVCVVVLLESAGHGGEVAAPVARGVLEKYCQLKAVRDMALRAADSGAELTEGPTGSVKADGVGKKEGSGAGEVPEGRAPGPRPEGAGL
jgi:penicillin-binding protein 2